MKLKTGDAIRVLWVDACGSSEGWAPPYLNGVEVENVGLFVCQNRHGMCTAKGLTKSPDGTYDLDQVLEPTFIPRGMVRSIKRLR